MRNRGKRAQKGETALFSDDSSIKLYEQALGFWAHDRSQCGTLFIITIIPEAEDILVTKTGGLWAACFAIKYNALTTFHLVFVECSINIYK